MPLNTLVIINRISNLSDARYCAGMGAEVLGFVPEQDQPGAVTEAAFKEITGWVAGVQLLGEFEQLPVAEINRVAQDWDLDLVQLNRLYPAEEVEQIQKPVVLRLPLEGTESREQLLQLLDEYRNEAAYFLLDSTPGTSLSPEQTELLQDLSNDYPLIIGFGITPENVQQVLEQVRPAGIRLLGGDEIRPGLRDFDQLAEILELLQPEED